MRKVDPSWSAFTGKIWLLALSWSMAVGTALYVAHTLVSWSVRSNPAPLINVFLLLAPWLIAWLTLGAALVLTYARRARELAEPNAIDYKAHKLLDSTWFKKFRLFLLGAWFAFTFFEVVVRPLFTSSDGSNPLYFDPRTNLMAMIYLALRDALLPLAFLAYALPSLIWVRRALSTQPLPLPQTTTATLVSSSRRIVQFFRWVMLGATGWLFVLVIAIPIIRHFGNPSTIAPVSSISLVVIVTLYTFWVPTALVRLAWLFSTVEGKSYPRMSMFLRFVAWSTPICLAIMGIARALIYDVFGLGGDPAGSMVEMLNLLLVFCLPAAAFVAVNFVYHPLHREMSRQEAPAA
jgi:hypothetical protein